MEKTTDLNKLLADYLIEEGRYDSDYYPQNIEIISKIPDSLNFQMRDPRIVLLSEKAYREDINAFKYKVNAIRGKLTMEGLIKINSQYNSIMDEEIIRRRIRREFFSEYPYLNEQAAIIGKYDWTKEGTRQMETLLLNETQDYYLLFGFSRDDEDRLSKKHIIESYIDHIEFSTFEEYKGTHDTSNGHELYILRKDPKIKRRTRSR